LKLVCSLKDELINETFGCTGLNEMVPDSLLSVFDEYELEVSRTENDRKNTMIRTHKQHTCW